MKTIPQREHYTTAATAGTHPNHTAVLNHSKRLTADKRESVLQAVGSGRSGGPADGESDKRQTPSTPCERSCVLVSHQATIVYKAAGDRGGESIGMTPLKNERKDRHREKE
ncbi:hypothetical protein RRG08_005314 [Elysia crispata]|uniref:Uncharacterized protein n=1 Tax=Elysia crispata TaxID=231223 RepID=A0AAE0Z072_9GAST|nr:hypothetical protein RRG08_005314 [Elysia crispata]